MSEPAIQIVGDRAILRQGEEVLVEVPLARLVQELERSAERQPSCTVLPAGVRRWIDCGDVVAAAVEVAPHGRVVRWLAEDSRASFGRGAKYAQFFVAFPFVELLLVFRRGSLTGFQQLYYRRASIEMGEDLLLPNLYNVARGYGQRCWVCLANLDDVGHLPWPAKINAVVDHVFTAAFNRSSEVHEGNSYWGAMRAVDPRVASLEAWQEATRENPRFPLEVAWKPAGTTVTEELTAMLGKVIDPLRVSTATDLAGALTRAGRKRGRA